jgi:hypothetical protein
MHWQSSMLLCVSCGLAADGVCRRCLFYRLILPLQEGEASTETSGDGLTVFDIVGRTFPLWSTVLLLVLTRISQVGLKKNLQR